MLFRIVEEWLAAGSAGGVVIGVRPCSPDEPGRDGDMGAVSISAEAGVLLAAAYMLTRRLWMSMGFHIAWNYTQSGVFFGHRFGGYVEPGLIQPVIDGPTC